MDFLPIFLNIKSRKILIDGGQMVAARRAQRALDAGAIVHVFNEQLCEDFISLLENERLIHHKRLPIESDFADCLIIYGASEDEKRDKFLYDMAQKHSILINVADVYKYCDFITPSILDRSPLVVAISSGGKAPVIARTLRAKLETLIPANYGRLANFLGSFRQKIAKKVKPTTKRRFFWEKIIEGTVGNLFLSGNVEQAQELLESELDIVELDKDKQKIGEVYLVGAGPGDPDLLTFRALRLMQYCDVVLYDRLIGDEIFSLIRRDAQRINVGKRANNHTMAQEEISQLMVDLAKQGKRVLRLKGGDPFLFGRGGEEIELLSENNIPFQIVPGITAATGAASYAGIPLTHRDYAQSCIFITAHGKDGALDIDWDNLMQKNQTIVIYMGLNNLQTLARGFIKHGIKPDMPVALVDNATRKNQIVIIGNIENINQKAIEAKIKGPTLIIVGEVVKLRESLKWIKPFEEESEMIIKAGE